MQNELIMSVHVREAAQVSVHVYAHLLNLSIMYYIKNYYYMHYSMSFSLQKSQKHIQDIH